MTVLHCVLISTLAWFSQYDKVRFGNTLYSHCAISHANCMVAEACLINLLKLICISYISRIGKDQFDVSFSVIVLLEIFCCKKSCNAKKVLLVVWSEEADRSCTTASSTTRNYYDTVVLAAHGSYHCNNNLCFMGKLMSCFSSLIFDVLFQ